MKKFFKKLKKHSTKDHPEKSPKEPKDSKQPDEEIENKADSKDTAELDENPKSAESEAETSFTELADQPEEKIKQSEIKKDLSEKDESETPKDEPKTERKDQPKKEEEPNSKTDQKSFLEGHRFDLEEIEKNTSLWVREVSQKTFYLTHFILLAAGLILISFLGYYLHNDQTLYDLHTSAPITKPPTSFRLNLNSPEDDLLTYEKSIIVSGETSPNSTLIIANNEQTTALEANSKGDFSKVVVLDPGVNSFVISSIDKSGNIKTIERSIYFTEEELPE